MRKKKLAIWGYVILLHAVVATCLLKTDLTERVGRRIGVLQSRPTPELSDFWMRTVETHLWQDASVPDGSVIFIGDSITQGLCVSGVDPRGVNFGISGDTTAGVLERVPKYRCLDRAAVVVLAVGVNDLSRRESAEIVENYRKILAAVPRRVVVCGILPVDESANKKLEGYNQRIRDLNDELRTLCRAHGCDFVESRKVGVVDGVHLSPAGYAVWISDLKKAIVSVP